MSDIDKLINDYYTLVENVNYSSTNELDERSKRYFSISLDLLEEMIFLIQEKYEPNILNESTIRTINTGFDHDIWIDNAGADRNVRHNEARIKVYVKHGIGKRKYPVIITNTDIKIITNDNKVRREIEKDKKLMDFIKNNRELFIMQYSMKYNHIFDINDFGSALIKYINDDLHSKREVIDYLFKGHEKEKPMI